MSKTGWVETFQLRLFFYAFFSKIENCDMLKDWNKY